MTLNLPTGRDQLLRRALNLAYFTVAWNVVEGVIAIWAAIDAGSDALLGFGLDSAVESISGLVLNTDAGRTALALLADEILDVYRFGDRPTIRLR